MADQAVFDAATAVRAQERRAYEASERELVADVQAVARTLKLLSGNAQISVSDMNLVVRVLGDLEREALESYNDLKADECNASFRFEMVQLRHEWSKLAAYTDRTQTSLAILGGFERATAVRAREREVFELRFSEVLRVEASLAKAMATLQMELILKNSGAFAHICGTRIEVIVHALGVIREAEGFSATDKSCLIAYVHQQHGDSAHELALVAPAPMTSTYIMQVFHDMEVKVESELGDLFKAEGSARFRYEILAKSERDARSAGI